MRLIGDLLKALHQGQLTVLVVNVAEKIILVYLVSELVEENLLFQGWIQIIKQLNKSHDLSTFKLSILVILVNS